MSCLRLLRRLARPGGCGDGRRSDESPKTLWRSLASCSAWRIELELKLLRRLLGPERCELLGELLGLFPEILALERRQLGVLPQQIQIFDLIELGHASSYERLLQPMTRSFSVSGAR
jgi:hypothetical protein